jgi:hypothetical protein
MAEEALPLFPGHFLEEGRAGQRNSSYQDGTALAFRTTQREAFWPLGEHRVPSPQSAIRACTEYKHHLRLYLPTIKKRYLVSTRDRPIKLHGSSANEA